MPAFAPEAASNTSAALVDDFEANFSDREGELVRYYVHPCRAISSARLARGPGSWPPKRAGVLETRSAKFTAKPTEAERLHLSFILPWKLTLALA